jgi:hypothetical protein
MVAPGVTIHVPLQTRDDRRRAERFSAEMPVSVDGHTGTTQDLSSSGLSFVADRAYELGARIDVVIEYLLDGHTYPLRCEAEVVRIELAEGGFRIGARLTPQSQLEEVRQANDEPAPDGTRQHLRSVD